MSSQGAGKRSKERKNLNTHPFAPEIEAEQRRSGQQLTHLSLRTANRTQFAVPFSKASDSAIKVPSA